jgi:hypothetical protein
MGLITVKPLLHNSLHLFAQTEIIQPSFPSSVHCERPQFISHCC